MPRIQWSHIFFPGLVFHELSHYIACLLFGVKVNKVRLFSTTEAYVSHDIPNAWQGILISVAPFAVGNFLGYYLLGIANALVMNSIIAAGVLYWLSIGLIFYAFPSMHDALNAFNGVKNFYAEKLVSGRLFSRLLWLITVPFVFLPLFLITGILLVMDYSLLLKALWVVFVVLASWSPEVMMGLTNSLLQAILYLFI